MYTFVKEETMLQKGLDVLQKAHEGYYAVGAFNFSNLEFAKAIVEAAEIGRAHV